MLALGTTPIALARGMFDGQFRIAAGKSTEPQDTGLGMVSPCCDRHGGLSFSLARLAATRGAHPLGIAAWESWIAGLLLLVMLMIRRISPPVTVGFVRLHLITSLVGMVLPGAAIFYAAAHVPAGVLSITVGIVPILTLAASAFFGLEKLAIGRIAGVVLGALAVVLLVGPQGSLPDPAQLPWVLIGFVAAVSYTTLNIVITLMAPPGANSLMLTCGMFVAASILMVPVIYLTGSMVPFGWPFGVTEWSLIGLGVVNAVAYPLYFWLVNHAGPVFGSLAANMVTLFGVVRGILIFSEQNSVWVWLSFATLMVALALVTPRRRSINEH